MEMERPGERELENTRGWKRREGMTWLFRKDAVVLGAGEAARRGQAEDPGAGGQGSSLVCDGGCCFSTSPAP